MGRTLPARLGSQHTLGTHNPGEACAASQCLLSLPRLLSANLCPPLDTRRFRPDARIRFRAVFSVDDDTMVPCADVERAFAAWRLRPRRLVGLFPLLLEADAPGGPVRFRGERHAIERGQYNLVEPGAAFMDSQSAFPAYFSDSVAGGRALVDETMNCDDILLNFVLANMTASALAGAGPDAVPQPAVQWLRPERRLDISRLSGVGELWPGGFPAL